MSHVPHLSEAMLTKIRKYIEKNYPNDDSLEFHAGELRGVISVVIPIEDEFVFEFLSKKIEFSFYNRNLF